MSQMSTYPQGHVVDFLFDEELVKEQIIAVQERGLVQPRRGGTLEVHKESTLAVPKISV